jgi:hypothetical protein
VFFVALEILDRESKDEYLKRYSKTPLFEMLCIGREMAAELGAGFLR